MTTLYDSVSILNQNIAGKLIASEDTAAASAVAVNFSISNFYHGDFVMEIKRIAAATVLSLSCVTVSWAQEDVEKEASRVEENTRTSALYGAFGSADTETPTQSGATPWAVGFYGSSQGSKNIFGIDIAGEGTSFNYTGNRGGAAEQAWSVNAILGRNLAGSRNFKLDAGILIGFRNDEQSCPEGQSNLGFDCYADSDKSVEYALNYGALVTVSFRSLMLGARVTGESTQAIIGIRF